MNAIKKLVAAYVAADGKREKVGAELRAELLETYELANGVGEILRDAFGEDATRRSHEKEYNALHFAWVTLPKREAAKAARGTKGSKNGKDGKNSGSSEDGGKAQASQAVTADSLFTAATENLTVGAVRRLTARLEKWCDNGGV